LYAVPAAVLDFLGGPALVRGANTVLVLLATVLVYLAARRMFGQGSALVAAVVFAINPVTIFAARFASVDALCFLTLATAFYLAIRSSERNVFAVLAGSLLALAVAEKFVVVLFVPGALGIALALNARQFGVRRAAGSIALMVGSTIATLVAVAALARDDWHGFTTTALGGRILTEAAGTPLWRAGWDYVGLVAVAGVAAVIAMKGHRRFSLLIVAAGLGPVLVEIGFHESASMQRNVGLSMIFLAPVIGVLGTRLVSRGRLLGVRAPVALASGILLLSTGMATSANMFHNWPTSTSIISALRYYAHDGTDRYLVDGSELAAYHLSDTTDYTQWASTLDDRYITPGGTERLREDLQSANFKLVLYRDDGATPALDRSMVATLRTRYTLVARVPVSPNDTHAYWSLWLAELPR
jgi:4-amino-4-deoxy-L-arabinose transferase-like glycosyltransferase